jgi:colicin import membrane protein
VAQVPKNFVPVSMAVILHVVLFGSMLVAFDWSRPLPPITPMAIQATLVTEIPEVAPAVVERQPEPEPEPEPVVAEPEPEPEPDNSEELRRQAEEEKRVQDAFIEKERLAKIRKQEEANRIKKEQEAAQRKRDEDARKEREREEAERKRREDIQRQREENERLLLALEAEQRQAELDAEERRFTARNSAAMDAYQYAIAQKIYRKWAAPASAGPETRCTVLVTQLPGGIIVEVNIRSCNGDEAVKRSIEAAIRNSSPLPEPSDPDLFDRNLTLNLTMKRDY